MNCNCTIVPDSVLRRFADDPDLSAELRQHLQNALNLDAQVRAIRQAATQLTIEAARMTQLAGLAAAPVAATPLVTVYDCRHLTTLPGVPVPNPLSSTDATAKRTFSETTAVADFY